MMNEIKNLNDALSGYLGTSYKIKEYDVKPLTAPGENYGSIILSVDITLFNKDTNSEKLLRTVVKLLPESEFLRKCFNVNVSFKNEVEFYRTIVPLLQNFQRDHGASVAAYFPKTYGSRVDFTGDNINDSSSLILENLKPDDFIVENRFVGFNEGSTTLILEHLADFHATGVAFKLKHPEVFQTRIKPYLDGTKMQDALPPGVYQKQCEDCKKILWDHPRLWSKIQGLFHVNEVTVREPFATVVHSDLWVNNILIKYDKQTAREIKFIDFQTIQYKSPADDLLLFLFSSVQNTILLEKLDFFINHYYQKFIKTLTDLKCDTTPFSYDAFAKEMEISFKEWQFLHIICMCYPIFKLKVDAEEMKEFTPDVLLKEEELSEQHKEKVRVVVEMFDKKGWI